MTIIVTGGAGFIGSNFTQVRHLGHRLRTVGRAVLKPGFYTPGCKPDDLSAGGDCLFQSLDY